MPCIIGWRKRICCGDRSKYARCIKFIQTRPRVSPKCFTLGTLRSRGRPRARQPALRSSPRCDARLRDRAAAADRADRAPAVRTVAHGPDGQLVPAVHAAARRSVPRPLAGRAGRSVQWLDPRHLRDHRVRRVHDPPRWRFSGCSGGNSDASRCPHRCRRHRPTRTTGPRADRPPAVAPAGFLRSPDLQTISRTTSTRPLQASAIESSVDEDPIGPADRQRAIEDTRPPGWPSCWPFGKYTHAASRAVTDDPHDHLLACAGVDAEPFRRADARQRCCGSARCRPRART